MIGSLHGTARDLGKQTVLVETQSGVGYAVFVSAKTKEVVLGEKNCYLYTYAAVSQTASQLFGFLDREEYSVFNLLITISGIGPKRAIEILERMPASSILDAVSKEDTDMFIQFGVAKKVAQKILLELGKKVDVKTESMSSDLIATLLGLGYERKEIQAILKNIDTKKTLEEQIQQALQQMR